MFILSVGGDLRYAHLALLAPSRALECAAAGMERCPLKPPHACIEDAARADAIILPNPWRGGIQLPFAEQAFTPEDIFSRIRPGTPVLLSDAVSMPDALTRRFPAVKWVDLSRDEAFIQQNARLTAEGALCSAMQRSDHALMDSTALVIGYGRIGFRLTELLLCIGARTFVAARRKEARSAARDRGACALPMEDLPSVLPHARFIFSTVPAAVLSDALLSLIPRDAVLMDLASPPFGFDLSRAQKMSLAAVRESGLPGRYCPCAAGSALLDAAVRALAAHLKGGPA